MFGTRLAGKLWGMAAAVMVLGVGQGAFGLAITDPGTKTFGDPSFQLALTGANNVSAVNFTLESSTSPQAVTVTARGMVTINAAGSVVIKATEGNNEATVQITINPKNLADPDVKITISAPSGGYVYNGTTGTNGTAHLPTEERLTVTFVSGTTTKTLTRTTDYTVTGHGTNINATRSETDSGTVTITAAGGNFTGSKTGNFYIAPKNISNTSSIKLLGEMPFTFTNSRVYFETEVRLNATDTDPTPSGTDYDIEYLRGNEVITDINDILVNAGTVTVRAAFKGNFTGSRSANFVINKRALSLDLENSSAASKVYDGTNAAEISVAFSGAMSTLEAGVDYSIGSPRFNNANAGEDRTVTATISLIANSLGHRNYSLTNGSFSKGRITIHKADVGIEHFDFKFPPDSLQHRYTGVAQGLHNGVNIKSGLSGMGTRSVYYGGLEAGVRPIEVGEYSVSVNVLNNGSNFNGGSVNLGTYVIEPALPPEITEHSADTTVRLNSQVRLQVTAESPNGGTLRYRWYRNGELISGASQRIYTVTVSPPTFEANESYDFQVEVINNRSVTGANGNGTQRDSVKSGTMRVGVIEAARSLSHAVVSVGGEYAYTGAAIEPYGEITVKLGGDTVLVPDVDYAVSFADNVNASTRASVIVRGIDAYADSATGRFTIRKKILTVSDFMPNSSVAYNGGPQPIELVPAGGGSGLGAATILYDGGSDIPEDVGEYRATLVSIAEGDNYTAFTPEEPFDLGVYRITKKVPTADDAIFEIPSNHFANGQPQGIGEVTLKGTGYGTVTVRYNGADVLPVDIGVYVVTAVIEGGTNYSMRTITLGNYEILDPASSVAEGINSVPDYAAGGIAVVTPVNVPAATFAVGPNPAYRSSGAVNLYIPGSSPVSPAGLLTVYNAAGSVVRRINIVSNVTAWDLKDANGRPVPAGAYLIRGSINTAGKREMVSTVVGVR